MRFFSVVAFFLLGVAVTMSSNTALSSVTTPRPVAIVTGGTRGIGSGIAAALADAGYDLLLTYNSNVKAAEEYAATFTDICRVECVGGDISLTETRDKVFACLDAKFADQPLKVSVFTGSNGSPAVLWQAILTHPHAHALSLLTGSRTQRGAVCGYYGRQRRRIERRQIPSIW